MRHSVTRQTSAPAGLDIRWMSAAGVRYVVAVVFEDDSRVWTDPTTDLDAAVLTVWRLASQHDKPVRRGAQSNKVQRAREY